MQHKDYGKSFHVGFDKGRSGREALLETVISDARRNLPKGVVFEIRKKPLYLSGSQFQLAWYSIPSLEAWNRQELVECHDIDAGVLDECGGFVFIGRIKNGDSYEQHIS